MTERMLQRANTSEVKRTDDNLESFHKRIVTYHEHTLPIVELFRQQGKLIELNAEQSPDGILDEFLAKKEFEI
jgi:UMP-CMP kinase